MADPILVVVFLRGGADALNLVSPTADADYIAARPEYLRVTRKDDGQGHRLTDALADVDFRLHPAAGELSQLFHAGDLSILHATGLITATRSHFDAEARIEQGTMGTSDGGWLGRWMRHATPGGPLPALAVGTGMPESLRGSRPAVAPNLSELMLAPGHWLAPALRARMQAGFGAHGPLDTSVQDILALSEMLESRLWQPDIGAMREYQPSVQYPDNELATSFKTVAQAIKEGLGLRIATVDYGGWDTHADQAATFPGLLAGLSGALYAFWRDLGPLQQDVAIVIQSEFGRRLRANDSGGTDHGRAGAMMVLGPQARGGRLLGRWPGLTNDRLDEGADLAVTTDYRDVLAEVLTGHMGLTDVSAIFPGLTQSPLGLYS
jgi:uncharacterized protein (DUF1501 family)